jgi:hypothetical protein
VSREDHEKRGIPRYTANKLKVAGVDPAKLGILTSRAGASNDGPHLIP